MNKLLSNKFRIRQCILFPDKKNQLDFSPKNLKNKEFRQQILVNFAVHWFEGIKIPREVVVWMARNVQQLNVIYIPNEKK